MKITLKNLIFFLFSIVFIGFNDPAAATMLVEDYPLLPAEKNGTNEINRELSSWLKRHLVSSPVSELTSTEIDKLLRRENSITRSFGHAMREKKLKNTKDLLARLVDLESEADKYNKSHAVHHPLTAYIYQAIRAAKPKNEAFDQKMADYYTKEAPNSCPHKSYVQTQLSSSKFLKSGKDNINRLLSQAQDFKSYRSRNAILRQVLYRLPSKSRKDVIEELWPLVKNFSHHLHRNKWLEKLINIPTDREGLYAKAKYSARRKHCNTARNQFIDALRTGENLVLSEARAVAKSIGNCAKRRGSVRRIQAWKKMTEPLEKAFGTSGWAAAKIAVARYEWTLDRFEIAEKVLGEVINRTATEKNDKFLAEATYVLAQIYEDKGDQEIAVNMYESYRLNFPKDQQVNKVLSTLLLTYAGKGEWKKVLSPANQIINSQNDLAIDEREVSVLGFALFWQGRAFLELKNQEFAQASFQRLAKEFYSTYYGAIGHYLLEQMGGTKWALKSGPSVGFDKKEWYRKFDKTDRVRLNRIETLLRLGMKTEAQCEISELDVGELSEKRLVKALILHSSGRWLSAIKTYSHLPRSFRHTLPYGMEKLLFPKKFDVDIKDYANRLGVDPDLVFALIRQESVFNPKARSPAGAIGLMQLMPRTASLEAKKIRSPYVTKKIRRSLLSQVKESKNLFSSDTNLILGTHHLHRLLSIYESPVFTLSAYNAGPTAAARWKGKIDTSDLLFFIEKIPYKETRGYVKLILRNYFYYSRWYGNKNKPLPHLQTVMQSMLANVEPEEVPTVFH